MMRTNTVTAIMLGLAGLLIAGCGKDDLTKLDGTWGQKEGDVVAKVNDLKKKFGDMTAKFETLKTTNVDDTTRGAEWARVDGMLKDQGNAIGGIDSTLARLAEQRTEVLKSGKRSDYEEAWKNADLEYERVISRIDALTSANRDIETKINDLTSPRPATGDAGDTAKLVPNDTAAKGTMEGKDIATSKEKRGEKDRKISIHTEQPDAPPPSTDTKK